MSELHSQFPRQVEFQKLENLPEKIAVTYLIWTLNGNQVIKSFPESSDFLAPHDWNHIITPNYLKFDNCPVNSPQDEAVTVAFQLFHTENFRQILSKRAKENRSKNFNIENEAINVREYFFDIIKGFLTPKQQSSIEIKLHLVRIFDLSWDLVIFLDGLGDPIGKNIKQIDEIANSFLKDENSSSLRSEDLNLQKVDFVFKYAENKFIMAIYNQIQTEINLLSQNLDNLK